MYSDPKYSDKTMEPNCSQSLCITPDLTVEEMMTENFA